MKRASPTLAEVAAAEGVNNERLLQAMRDVCRAEFIPAEYADLAEVDIPVPIGHEQVTSQPSLVAAMIQAADPGPDETVLEIGSGYGYQTALLASLARFVWGVEWWPDLARVARGNLSRAAILNAEVVVADGSQGLPEHSPYDVIIVSAAYPSIPPPLIDQLVSNGRLVQPVGPGGSEEVNLYVKDESMGLRLVKLVTYARFVPLGGAYGYGGQAHCGAG